MSNPDQTTNDASNGAEQSNQNEAIATKEHVEKVSQLEKSLKQKDDELQNYRKRISQLETELSEAQKFKAQHSKQADEVEVLKSQSEDALTRAKSIIFERTKVIKNQELQIEALNQQINSLKEVITITKDLLEIRNLEVTQIEGKMKCMEDKISAEKQRQDLMHQKLEAMIRHNGELKREYETQLCLFSSLREKYNQRDLAEGIVRDLQSDQVNGDAGTSHKEDEK